MKRVYSVFALLIATIALSGCFGTSPKIEVVEKPVVRVVTIPESLIRKCSTTNPSILPSEFMKLNASTKEEILTEYIVLLHADIKNCADVVEAIRDYSAKQKKLLEKENK